MLLQAILAELFVFVLLGGMSYLSINYFAIAPLYKMKSETENIIIFMSIPLGIYVIFRIYFKLSLYVAKRISSGWRGNKLSHLLALVLLFPAFRDVLEHRSDYMWHNLGKFLTGGEKYCDKVLSVSAL